MDNQPIGIWGKKHRDYLKDHHNAILFNDAYE